LVPSLLTGPAIVVLAAFQDLPYREALWLCAIAVDFGGPLIFGWAASTDADCRATGR
jgi:hypothetical protein